MTPNFKNKINNVIFKQISNSKIILSENLIWVLDEKKLTWYCFYNIKTKKVLWNEREFLVILKIFKPNAYQTEKLMEDFLKDFFSLINKNIINEDTNNPELEITEFIKIYMTCYRNKMIKTIQEGKILMESYEVAAPPEPGN
jgi:hypothetical protein